ncbi:hypothetical protein OHA21_10400 [Actinoplanes sp. NBC_00393]|uniref:hypothetical protein n=1 Tax=Actinoplanes sp. NBC_00393 TaxID=2975953 RepID=UPI002E1A9F62
MTRFAGRIELLDRLSRELREPAGPLVLIIGPDLRAAPPPWSARVLQAAEEHVRRLRNDELQAEIAWAQRIADLPARYAAYRTAFHDWLGPEEFGLVVQRTVLESYRPDSAEPSADARPGRLVNAEMGRIVELDAASWQVDPGLQALARLTAAFPDRLGAGLLTTRLDPAIEVALGQVGLAAEPVAPESPGAGSGAIPVVHLLGYWRPLSNEQPWPQVADRRGDRLPEPVAGRLRETLAGATICVIGVHDADPVLVQALRAAVSDGARVGWAVPEEHGYREPRIEAGDAVTVHHGVESGRLLEDLAARLLPENRKTPPLLETPRPRFHEQPSLHRLLRAIPLRTPAESAADLLSQLDKRFRWRLELPASPPPSLLFWPVRLRDPSVIHMVQALAAAALSAHGVHVVLVLDDFGPYPEWLRPAFAERVRVWFSMIPQAQPPEIIPLRAWIEEEERLQRPHRERPTRPWPVLQEYYGQWKPSVYDALRAAKILPIEELESRPEEAAQILELLRAHGAHRLLTAPAIWSLYHTKLLYRPSSEVMTLAGIDELFFWQHRQKVSGERTRHLYHPGIENLTLNSGLTRWEHHRDLQSMIERAVTREHWRRPDRYLPWMVEHAFLLPAYLRGGGGAELAGRSFSVWQDVVAALAEDPGLADPLARRISAWFLGEPE